MKLLFLAKVTLLFLLFSLSLQQKLPAQWTLTNDLIQATQTAAGTQAKLTFANHGKTDLTVTALEFSCPCVVFHFKSTTAKPGETGTVTITLDNWKDGLDDLDALAVGSDSSKPREFTIRVSKPESAK